MCRPWGRSPSGKLRIGRSVRLACSKEQLLLMLIVIFVIIITTIIIIVIISSSSSSSIMRVLSACKMRTGFRAQGTAPSSRHSRRKVKDRPLKSKRICSYLNVSYHNSRKYNVMYIHMYIYTHICKLKKSIDS